MSKKIFASRAVKEGWEAGEDVNSENPYKEGTVEHEDWNDGFNIRVESDAPDLIDEFESSCYCDNAYR